MIATVAGYSSVTLSPSGSADGLRNVLPVAASTKVVPPSVSANVRS